MIKIKGNVPASNCRIHGYTEEVCKNGKWYVCKICELERNKKRQLKKSEKYYSEKSKLSNSYIRDLISKSKRVGTGEISQKDIDEKRNKLIERNKVKASKLSGHPASLCKIHGYTTDVVKALKTSRGKRFNLFVCSECHRRRWLEGYKKKHPKYYKSNEYIPMRKRKRDRNAWVICKIHGYTEDAFAIKNQAYKENGIKKYRCYKCYAKAILNEDEPDLNKASLPEEMVDLKVAILKIKHKIKERKNNLWK